MVSKKEDNTGKTTKQKEKGPSKIKQFFMDERIRFIFGVLIFAFAMYLLIACTSYLLSWQTDQSITTTEGLEVKINNWGGKVGHIIAQKLIGEGFGFGAFFIPVIFGIIGLRLLNFPNLRTWSLTIKMVLATLLVSITLSYVFGMADGYLVGGPGGAHGYAITKFLNALIGKVGTFFFIFFSIVSYLVFFLKVNPSTLKPSFIFKPKTKVAPTIGEELPNDSPKNSEEDILGNMDTEEDGEEETEEENPINVSFNNNGSIVRDIGEESRLASSTTGIEGKPSQGAGLIINRTEEDDTLPEEEVNRLISDYDPRLDLSHYKFPPISILKEYKNDHTFDDSEVLENKDQIIKTLEDFKIGIRNISATVGPTVTLYEVVPDRGVKLARIKSLEDDIALNLSALGIRIIAPIPGRGTVGIEVPNKNPKTVTMRSLVSSKAFQETKFDIPLALGRTITNEPYIVDLTKMPHLLVAGATGQGKSVGINAILASILYKKHPAEVKFVLIDPKRVELPLYMKIERHFLAKLPGEDDAIITDTQKVINTLNSLCIEMDQRLELLKSAQSRNIKEYNDKFTSRRLNPEKGHKFLPYIVLVIDEFADLIMTAGREIEGPIGRLAQLARAIGIHLIISTQRPTTNIITGFIKANFPTRIAFRVFSSIDSRTILDSTGAERLVGRGDMLISSGNEPIRLQCAFVDTSEIEELTEFIGSQQGYTDAFLLPEYVDDSNMNGVAEVDLKKRDPLFDDAARLIVQHQQGSTSLIQRKLQLGYNRAGRIIDQLEAAGIVGPFEGSKARDVLYTDMMSLEQLLSNL